ncbi:hypothetical protein CEXT_136641 [Caerostris extrusa]|uniref:Uncharacterized protein n=1 Tax=Caerostris extrusa TaxID=172846 RepID=A0AAV4XA34_CAEEX|nr:hypothetical protein CEXT_136641 [Caerostris extrusa]
MTGKKRGIYKVVQGGKGKKGKLLIKGTMMVKGKDNILLKRSGSNERRATGRSTSDAHNSTPSMRTRGDRDVYPIAAHTINPHTYSTF